ncbi:MAG: ABC-F family ATP-binding cassette domain-containing protein [Clostridia bacterium]
MITTIDNLTFSYKDDIILQNITANIGDTDRIGLIGENGSGKTTLINLIIGRLSDYDGGIFTRKNLTIGYLEQNQGLESDNTVLEEMRLCFSKLLKMEVRMREIEIEISTMSHDTIEYRAVSNEYNELKKVFEAFDGYNVDVKIKTVLNGLGFLGLYDRIISTFSGGEKTRLAIAKLLLLSPELLIMDEPTNHLDFETLMWLEEYLKSYKGALLIVSHDRFFLDNTVDRIWELENKSINAFRGNYTKYKQLKQEQVDLQLKEYDKQQEEIAKMEDYVARNLVRATTSKSALSRVKKLDAMERIEKPITYKKKPTFSFVKAFDPTKEVLKVDNLTLYAGDKLLFENGSFLVRRGEKVAIVGENGTGKSTLLRSIMKAFDDEKDKINFGKNVTISYYDQENLNLNFENTVIDELWDKYPHSEIFELRKSLGRMLFENEDMEKKISVLSGGERARLGFAIMMMRQSNFLIMDEPTNHIDLETRETLEKALVDFDGTVLFVSHDRYFLNAIATKIVKVGKDGIQEYAMGFDAYLQQRKLEKQLAEKPVIEQSQKKTTFKNPKERKEEAKLKIDIKNIETEISEVENEIAKLNDEMLVKEIACDYSKLSVKLKTIEKAKKQLDDLMEEWEILSEKITENN